MLLLNSIAGMFCRSIYWRLIDHILKFVYHFFTAILATSNLDAEIMLGLVGRTCQILLGILRKSRQRHLEKMYCMHFLNLSRQ